MVIISFVNIDVSMASRPDVLELFIPWKLLLLLQLLNNLFDINRIPDNHCICYQIETTNLITELLIRLFSNFSLVGITQVRAKAMKRFTFVNLSIQPPAMGFLGIPSQIVK